MIQKIFKEERKSLCASIDLFKKSKLPYSSTNHVYIAKVPGAETRHRNNKDTAEQSTSQVNNAKPTKTKSTLHKKMLFKDKVSLPTHSFLHILSH